jgi:hypothetical protein
MDFQQAGIQPGDLFTVSTVCLPLCCSFLSLPEINNLAGVEIKVPALSSHFI